MRPEEAAAVAVAFEAALARIGAEVVVEAIRLYLRVNPANLRTTGSDWLDDAVQLVSGYGEQARLLGIAYLRLYRALMTGHTLNHPDDAKSSETSLGELRDDFVELTRGLPSDVAYNPPRDSDHIRIPVEDYEIETPEERRDNRRDREEQATLVLTVLGLDSVEKKTRDLDLDKLSAREADRVRQEAITKATSRQAAAASRIARNGARSAVFHANFRDRRSVAYARISRTGTPCGFCAMLISRGAVYKTAETAGEGNQYHDNCNCYAIPIYSRREYEREARYALNRELQKLWQDEIAGKYSGNEARRVWNRLIRNRYRSTTTRTYADTAQAA